MPRQSAGDRAGQSDYTGSFVFPNDFAALLPDAGEAGPGGLFEAAPVSGEARVICYSSDHGATMARLPEAAIGQVIAETWCSLGRAARRWRWLSSCSRTRAR